MWASPADASKGVSDTPAHQAGCGLLGLLGLEIDGPS